MQPPVATMATPMFEVATPVSDATVVLTDSIIVGPTAESLVVAQPVMQVPMVTVNAGLGVGVGLAVGGLLIACKIRALMGS